MWWHVGVRSVFAGFVAAVALAGTSAGAQGTEPPFSGTIFIDPDILNRQDPSVTKRIKYAGRGTRTVFDRRENDWVRIKAYLFRTRYSDGLRAEVQVNPEFGRRAAGAVARRYATIVGRLPRVLRADIEDIVIHKGKKPFGGGNRGVLIHTGMGAEYAREGILEETLVHEACHTSLDLDHARAPGWISAQQSDPTFISTYARDNPTREDVAESFLPWLALRMQPDRIDATLAAQIEQAIPHRLQYFDQQNFELGPLTP